MSLRHKQTKLQSMPIRNPSLNISPGECPENDAKQDSYLSVSPNDQYLAISVYQLMEVGGAGEGCLSGNVTVFVCESGASFLCVTQQLSESTLHNKLLQ